MTWAEGGAEAPEVPLPVWPQEISDTREVFLLSLNVTMLISLQTVDIIRSSINSVLFFFLIFIYSTDIF